MNCFLSNLQNPLISSAKGENVRIGVTSDLILECVKSLAAIFWTTCKRSSDVFAK